MAEAVAKAKKPSRWQAFRLRVSLFRIWFMKNILVFLQALLITLAICTFTGVITMDTPIFGPIIYPIFAPYIDAVNESIEEKDMDSLVHVVVVILSALASVGVFMTRAKSIAQSDIKSKKVKLALVKAGFYFNEDGQLVKKVEKMTRSDIDGDGKIGDKDIYEADTVTRGFFSGAVNAVKEFITIATADLTDKTKNEALEETGLHEAAEGVEEVKDTIIRGGDKMAQDEIDRIEEGNKPIKEDEPKEDDDKVTVPEHRNLSDVIKSNIHEWNQKRRARKAARKAAKQKRVFYRMDDDSMAELKKAVYEMSRIRRGALIAIMGKDNIFTNGSVIQPGTKIDWEIKSQTILDMFIVGTPLHDGAAVIDEDRIVRGAVFVQPTKQKVKGKFGARHQAAKGLSEHSDSIVILVSEETGDVLFFFKGFMEEVPEEKFEFTIKKDYALIELNPMEGSGGKTEDNPDSIEVITNKVDEDSKIDAEPKADERHEEIKPEEADIEETHDAPTVEQKHEEPKKAAAPADPVAAFLSKMRK